MVTRTRGSATWADTDPRGRLRGAQAKGQVGKWIGPTGIVGPMFNRDKGGVLGPVGDTNRLSAFPSYRQKITFLVPYGTKEFLMYAGNVVALQALDQSARKSARGSDGSRST